MSNYLLEIGLEEMPAHLVTPAVLQLSERMEGFLKENRISFKHIEVFSTPRRLALLVEKIASSSESIDEEVKGPSAKIAKDEKGDWSKAVQGFSRGQGVTPDDLVLKGDYYYANKHVAGVDTAEVLTKVGSEVIEKMQFNTYMKWANNSFLFIRPIQWMVSLLDSQVVPFTVLDVEAGRVSRGHRFLANRNIELVSAQFYEKALQENSVIAWAPARMLLIEQEIAKIARKHELQIFLHEELLEEVNNLVEWPTAFLGQFDKKYLDVPEEVLVTSMREHQRYFEVHEKDGHLAPYFVAVRNGHDEYMDNVIKGNEKVLVARLEDAKFFWAEDKKLKIDDLVKKLEQVTFHAKIGSISEHMARTKAISTQLSKVADLTAEQISDVARASDIYKFDLLTGMVGEFDELQGVMGEKYALLAGEKPAVALAIREHYMPTSADGELPDTLEGAVLAVADKLDSILSFFSAGLIPSGSNDPYALRRAAQGLIRIIEKFGWKFDLTDFIASSDIEHKEEVLEFIKGRVQKILSDKHIRHDIIEAVINAQPFDIFNMLIVAPSLDHESMVNARFKLAIENISRVINLVDKADITADINTELFENDSEKALYAMIEKLNKEWSGLPVFRKISAILDAMTPVISDFFDNVMVMAEDEKVKNNRLSLLNQVVALTAPLANFSLINSK